MTFSPFTPTQSLTLLTRKKGADKYDPEFGDDKKCARCSHAYYRHFDTYYRMASVGCKYCSCRHFVEEIPGMKSVKKIKERR